MHHPNCCHCHKGSSVHQAWKHIYHHKRTTCFWSRSHHCIMVAYDSWQKLACLPCSKGRHIAWGIGPACSKGTLTVLGLCSPLQLSLVPQCCWYFFTALRLFQFNHLTIGTQLWTWKLNCITFLAFQIIYNLTMVHFVCNGYPIMNQ